MEEISVKQREIWLCPFPFSDLSGKKVRPVLILSNARYNSIGEDVIVCALTSNVAHIPNAITIDQANCEHGVLFQQSSVRIDTLFKIKKALLIKSICTINQQTFTVLFTKLQNIFHP